jgi:glycosyltransferase involved in cell wall biosynthesis
MNAKKNLSAKRVAVSALKRQKLIDPAVYLSPRRIDIAAKTIYARAYLEDNTSTWPTTVYKEHLRAFNNFYEKEPLKNKFEDFTESFQRTIDSVKNSDNWKHKAPVHRNGTYLVNGAHRVAASIVTGDLINSIVPKKIYDYSYDHTFFKRDKDDILGIDENILDYMTVEYVSLKKKNIFVALVFPSAEGLRDEAYEHLLKLGEIVNMKTFKHDEFVGKEIVKQLYFNSNNDAWNYGLDFESAEHKANHCFDGSGDLQVYVLEANLDESTRIKEKKYLRDLWKKDKHSIHITDTIDEANRVVRMFFNENSRRFLKIDREQEFNSQKMYEMFDEYIRLAPKDSLDRESVAIEGSAVLDLLNIRSGKDIDYISRNSAISFSSQTIEKHAEDENVYHTQSIDEILTNPEYYFYYKGYKFVDILEILKYKIKRSKDNNEKDTNDVRLIEAFLRKNPQYGYDTENTQPKYPLVSIIMPIFNTPDEYLTVSLEGIQKQDYKNLEIILVDDGSDKKTADLIDIYVSELKDDRWKVIHQKNKGLSGARNAGYDVSTGKYIQFLDADDSFDRRLIQKAVMQAERTNADVVLENYLIKDYDTGAEGIALVDSLFPNKDAFTLSEMNGKGFGTVPYSVWSKLFKKEFLDIHSIRHDEHLRRAEDVPFTMGTLAIANKIAAVKDPLILYRENLFISNSKSNDKYPDDSVRAWKKLYEFLKDNNVYDTFKSEYELSMLGSLRWHFDRLYLQDNKTILAKAAKSFFDTIHISAHHDFRVLVELSLINPELINILDEKNDRIQDLEAHTHHAQATLEILHARVVELEQLTIKQASRKLAGALKRRAERSFKK